jgi:hypothetical protein
MRLTFDAQNAARNQRIFALRKLVDEVACAD